MMDYTILPEREHQVGRNGNLGILVFSSAVQFFFIYYDDFLIIIYIYILFFSCTFILWLPFLATFADKDFTTKNRGLVNFEDLNYILRSEFFLQKDGQLRATHVILRYTPISTRFQSLKNIIKNKDPRLARIVIVVKGFLQRPPPKGNQLVELLTQQVS